MLQRDRRIEKRDRKMRKKRRKRYWLIFLLAGILLVGGCSKNENEDSATPTVSAAKDEIEKDAVIMTVDDQVLTYAETMLYLRSKKQEVENLYGKDIWHYKLDKEGTTYEEMLKSKLLEDLKYIKIVCAQATELGITLTEDELLDVDEYTVTFLSNFKEEDLKYYGFDKEIVRDIYKDNVLANKVYESLTLNVDTDVSDEEARQAEFFYILIAKYGFDEEGNRIEYTKEQLEDTKTRAESIYQRALKEEDFYTLAKEVSDDDDEINIIVGHGDMAEDLEKAAFALKQGEISPIVENDTGYFIFYCVSELNEDATNAAKEEIIMARQEKLFHESYNNWESAAKITINEKLWNQISLADEDISLKQEITQDITQKE